MARLLFLFSLTLVVVLVQSTKEEEEHHVCEMCMEHKEWLTVLIEECAVKLLKPPHTEASVLKEIKCKSVDAVVKKICHKDLDTAHKFMESSFETLSKKDCLDFKVAHECIVREEARMMAEWKKKHSTTPAN